MPAAAEHYLAVGGLKRLQSKLWVQPCVASCSTLGQNEPRNKTSSSERMASSVKLSCLVLAGSFLAYVQVKIILPCVSSVLCSLVLPLPETGALPGKDWQLGTLWGCPEERHHCSNVTERAQARSERCRWCTIKAWRLGSVNWGDLRWGAQWILGHCHFPGYWTHSERDLAVFTTSWLSQRKTKLAIFWVQGGTEFVLVIL